MPDPGKLRTIAVYLSHKKGRNLAYLCGIEPTAFAQKEVPWFFVFFDVNPAI
jgi:hypothetical protein